MKIKKLVTNIFIIKNLRKFVLAASKIIYKLRMEKRLLKLKTFLKGITTKAECR